MLYKSRAAASTNNYDTFPSSYEPKNNQAYRIASIKRATIAPKLEATIAAQYKLGSSDFLYFL
jgi:hypothetical protein